MEDFKQDNEKGEEGQSTAGAVSVWGIILREEIICTCYLNLIRALDLNL